MGIDLDASLSLFEVISETFSGSLLDASWSWSEVISAGWLEFYYPLVNLGGQCFLPGFPVYLLLFMLFPARTQHSRGEPWTTVFTLCGALLGIVLAAPLTQRVFGDAYVSRCRQCELKALPR